MNKITFEEYKRAIKAKYEVFKRDEVSGILLNPTPAQLRNLCLMKSVNGLSNVDESLFRIFFDWKSDGNLRRTIENSDIGKLRPIISFLKGQKDSDNAIRIELAAFLVDFSPRPYNQYLRNGPMADKECQETSLIIPKNTKGKVDYQIDNHAHFPLPNFLNNTQGRKSAIIMAILIVLFFLGYSINEVLFSKKECMKWEGNHYEAVDCFNEKEQFGLIGTFDKEAMKLRKLDCSSEMKFFNSGKPVVWYVKRDGMIELYNNMGFHPVTGKPLKPITKYIIEKYNLTH